MKSWFDIWGAPPTSSRWIKFKRNWDNSSALDYFTLDDTITTWTFTDGTTPWTITSGSEIRYIEPVDQYADDL